MSGNLPASASERNEYPLADGLLYYFPAALAAVARVSKIGNDQHNPGEPMHWARGKSTDHANKILRHQLDAGALDSDGTRHSAKVAWRALAQLQEELEREEGAPLPRNAWLDQPLRGMDHIQPEGCNPSATREAKIAYDVACDQPKGSVVIHEAGVPPPGGWKQFEEPERIPKWDPAWGKAPNCDGLVARDIRAPHPMQAEVIREHDERLQGPEDAL